jgi:hypothetical protein
MINSYVAGRTNMLAEVREVQGLLVANGHRITHDWTRTVEAVGGAARDNVVSPEDQRVYAERDLKGVVDATDIWVVCGPGLCGTLIEVGAALALGKRVHIIGEPERHSVFFHMPTVSRVPSVRDLQVLLGGSSPSGRV